MPQLVASWCVRRVCAILIWYAFACCHIVAKCFLVCDIPLLVIFTVLYTFFSPFFLDFFVIFFVLHALVQLLHEANKVWSKLRHACFPLAPELAPKRVKRLWGCLTPTPTPTPTGNFDYNGVREFASCCCELCGHTEAGGVRSAAPTATATESKPKTRTRSKLSLGRHCLLFVNNLARFLGQKDAPVCARVCVCVCVCDFPYCLSPLSLPVLCIFFACCSF